MIIHVVKEGETLPQIAAMYNVSLSLISRNNEIAPAETLVPGQTIVIQFPSVVYTVSEGDTLISISREYGVSLMTLLQNNPHLNNLRPIYPGETIVISYEGEKLRSIAVNGYTYPGIDELTLRKTLPFLTYITIFTYGIKNDGKLIGIDDSKIITIAQEYGVAPIMLISSLNEEGKFSNQLSSLVLNSDEIKSVLMQDIIDVMKAKGYKGLSVDFEYVFPEERELYVEFVSELKTALEREGLWLFVALAPKTSDDQPGLLYEAHDYGALGAVADKVILMTYEWGYAYSPPMPVAPIDSVRKVLDYAVTRIPPEKIFMGVPNYGYDWTLPYVEGESKAKSISNVNAVKLARENNAEILFDETAYSPYFYYTKDGNEHIVYFEDARSINAKALLVPEYGFYGLSYWNIMKYFPQNWLVLISLFDIEKFSY
ncbi:MAG: glycosyl hydrolase family 18 protein [Lachnospiraceae bacterium]|nr:glycosyl hydrolase family 18 protein [Lachnospiraceae bacterium]